MSVMAQLSSVPCLWSIAHSIITLWVQLPHINAQAPLILGNRSNSSDLYTAGDFVCAKRSDLVYFSINVVEIAFLEQAGILIVVFVRDF